MVFRLIGGGLSVHGEDEMSLVDMTDTDTVGAIAGGLAGLYYGYDTIPQDWLGALQRREWIEGLVDNGHGA